MSALMWNAGGTGRPVPGALRSGDGAPREGGPGQPELLRPLPGLRQDAVPPAQRVRGRVRIGVGQHRQDEGLGVPERVAVVTRPGQALGRDRTVFGAGAGLEHLEQREPHCLLDLWVAFQRRRPPWPRSHPGTPAAGRPARPSRWPSPRPARPGPGPGSRAASADWTSRTPGT